jgi:hypothetical protein
VIRGDVVPSLLGPGSLQRASMDAVHCDLTCVSFVSYGKTALGSLAVQLDIGKKANGWTEISWRDSTLATVVFAFDEIGSIFHHVASHPWRRYGELHYRLCAWAGRTQDTVRKTAAATVRNMTKISRGYSQYYVLFCLHEC